jgi:predicted MFS family arabinose efflux permease
MRAAVAVPPAASGSPSRGCVIGACVPEILGLAGYSIVPALLPRIMEDRSLNSAQGGWLAGIISGGYMLGVLRLVAATGRLPARTVYLACATLSVLSSFALAESDMFAPALFFRALTGLGLAGVYRPGLRALTAGIEVARRARVAALYTSSFTIGTALSFLFGRTGILWGWRAAFMIASIMSLAGLVLAWATLPRHRSRQRRRRPCSRCTRSSRTARR